MHGKHRLLGALILILLLPLTALAQQVVDVTPAQPMPTDLLGWAALVAAVLFPTAIVVLGVLAPRTKTDIDDKALAGLQAAWPKLKDWLDPTKSDVPPTPSNPEGRA